MAKDKLMSFLSSSIGNGAVANGGSSSSLSSGAAASTVNAGGVALAAGVGGINGHPAAGSIVTSMGLFHLTNGYHRYDHSIQSAGSPQSAHQSPPPPHPLAAATAAAAASPAAANLDLDLTGVSVNSVAAAGNIPFSHSDYSLHNFSVATTAGGGGSGVTSPASAAAAATAALMSESDMQDLSLEIEKERHEYLEKSKTLQEQLRTLKSEIDELKVDEKVSVLDQLHREQAEQGDTKYSTIQKVKRGSMQSRVAFFEEL